MASTVTGNAPKAVTVNASTVVQVNFETAPRWCAIQADGCILSVYAAGTDGGSGSGDLVKVPDGGVYPWEIAGPIFILGSGAGTARLRCSSVAPPVVPSPGGGSASIADGSVTNAKLADMATQRIKGRTTAGTGAPEDLTPLQAWRVANPMQTLSISTGAAAVDISLGLNWELTVTGTVTISNPTGSPANGDIMRGLIRQNGTGGYPVDFGSAFEKPPVWSGANQVTVLTWVYDSTASLWRLQGGTRTIRRKLGSDTVESAGTATVATGAAFVPVAGGHYTYRYVTFASSANSAVGAQLSMDPGNNTGSVFGQGRGSSATAVVSRIEPLVASTPSGTVAVADGGGAPAMPGEVQGHIIGAGASPTAFGLRVQSETGGTAVTLLAATMLEVTRLD